MGNIKVVRGNKIKYILKQITVGSKLLWLFILCPAVAFGIAYLIWELSVQTWHSMAYTMQLGAFIIFIIRLDSLYRNYDSEGLGYIGAIKRWLKSIIKPESNNLSVGTISGLGKLTSLFNADPLKEGSIEERVQWLETQLLNLRRDLKIKIVDFEEKFDDLESKLDQAIEEIREELRTKKNKERNLHLPNLGRELVAVLWLIYAAVIFAITGLMG